jgi:hypothetical protein
LARSQPRWETGGAFLFQPVGQSASVNPRPLHRSITFWSGIFVMAFICWAWEDSMRYGAWWSAGNHRFGAEAGYVSLNRRIEPTVVTGLPKRSEHSYSDLMLLPTLPPPLFVRGGGNTEFDPIPFGEEEEKLTYHQWIAGHQQGRPPEDWVLMIPHWLLLLAVAVPWVALLLWRARRVRRASAISQD